MDIKALLTDRLAGRLIDAVASLEIAITAGMVPNTLYTGAKDTISRGAHEATEAFLATGPHEAGHHQSDWWLAAYRCEAFVSGITNVPTALKRAQKHGGLTEYAALLAALLPLHELLNTAKPLVKKRGELPKVKSPKQIADEADQMTCQCCGRAIFAATGLIAHHGYQRPGDGYQTRSCMGARELPFEVSRDILGKMIAWIERDLMRLNKALQETEKEQRSAPFWYQQRPKGSGSFYLSRERSVAVTRDTFEMVKEAYAKEMQQWSGHSFDDLKAQQVRALERNIEFTQKDLAEQQKRFDGWKQTQQWSGKWEPYQEAAA